MLPRERGIGNVAGLRVCRHRARDGSGRQPPRGDARADATRRAVAAPCTRGSHSPSPFVTAARWACTAAPSISFARPARISAAVNGFASPCCAPRSNTM